MRVLVTGASRGIGAAIALRFARSGHDLVLLYHRSYDQAEKVAEQCAGYGVDVVKRSVDVADRDGLLELKAELEDQRKMPDVLVNNAGLAHYGMLADLRPEEWEKLLKVNITGMLLCTQLFTDAMIRQRFGRIINISSVWGIAGAACEAAYAATKGAVNAFTKSMAKELAPCNITVNAVAPGVVDTEMIACLTEEERRELRGQIPLQRFASPREIAEAVHFLSQKESSYITGQILCVDGGWQT